jgi:hypothetical protein
MMRSRYLLCKHTSRDHQKRIPCIHHHTMLPLVGSLLHNSAMTLTVEQATRAGDMGGMVFIRHTPVVPEVYMNVAGSSGLGCTGSATLPSPSLLKESQS